MLPLNELVQTLVISVVVLANVLWDMGKLALHRRGYPVSFMMLLIWIIVPIGSRPEERKEAPIAGQLCRLPSSLLVACRPMSNHLRGASLALVVSFVVLVGCTRWGSTPIASYGPYQNPVQAIAQAQAGVQTRGYVSQPAEGGFAFDLHQRGLRGTFRVVARQLHGGYIQLLPQGTYVRAAGMGAVDMPVGTTDEYVNVAANLLPAPDLPLVAGIPPGALNPTRVGTHPDGPLIGVGIGFALAGVAWFLTGSGLGGFGDSDLLIWGLTSSGFLVPAVIMILVGALRQDRHFDLGGARPGYANNPFAITF